MLGGRRDRVSKLATSVLDDGDDLCITPSFVASEENSSVIGNASCFEPMKSNNEAAKKPQSDDDNTTPASSTINDQEDDDTNDKSKRILQKLPFSGNLRYTKSFRPWRLNARLLRGQSLYKTIQEYEELVEDVSPTFEDSDASSIHSIRSSRRNVGTGRSLLVRQNAQVIGRPSMAETQWDIGSLSSESSASTRRGILTRNRSDDSVSSDISHLTGDSFRSKKSEFSMSRAMYIDNSGALLGETIIEASDDESDENESPNSIFFADFRPTGFSEEKSQLSRDKINALLSVFKKQNQNQYNLLQEETVYAGESENGKKHPDDLYTTPAQGAMENTQRQRIFSDTDIVFERQRQRSEWKAYDHLASQNEIDSPLSSERNVLINGERPRTLSDSMTRNEVSIASERKRISRRQRLMSDPLFDSSRTLCSSRTRGISDSDISVRSERSRSSRAARSRESASLDTSEKKQQRGSEWITTRRRNKDKEIQTRVRSRLSSDSELTMASVRNVSTLNWPLQPQNASRSQRPRTKSDSEMSGRSGTPEFSMASRSKRADEDDATQRAMRSLESISALSSPTALSAARQIASALRPALAPVPARSLESRDYYWNHDSDSDSSSQQGQEVLWSLASESFDDIL